MTPYKIYSASAGSGKTFTLVKAYLNILLSPDFNINLRQLLAITFTNKAVNEMKQRILSSLYEFGQLKNNDDANPLFNSLLKELEFTPEELRLKSQKALKKILHNYAYFDISTIDKFTHRLIRTFAKDLKLPQNFEVVLDTDMLLDEAVNRLLDKAGTNKKLTTVLIAFALEKIDASKSWDISIDLNKIGALLFNENHYPHLKRLDNRKIEDFLKLRQQLLILVQQLELKAKSSASKMLQFIQECGLEDADFPRETLPNHFKKIQQGIFQPEKLYNNKLEENLLNGKILKSGISLPSMEISNTILSDYLNLKETIYKMAFLKNAYVNSVPLTILSAIQQELKGLEIERDLLPISSFNQIISNEIKNQPAPFIYERLGEKYRHYFIDEFQDTSEMQWKNLIPLIGNALESEDEQGKPGSLFLVGDAKQAIYRWRGGRAEQFLSLLALSQQPFVVAPNVKELPTNFRSKPELVEFNNTFFTSISTYLNNEEYQSIYVEGNRQQSNKQHGGYVALSFLEKGGENDIDKIYCDKVLHTIAKALEQSYSYRDICILTRKRKQGILISDFLMQQNIPLVSSETLLLKRNNKVAFLMMLLRSCVHPKDLDNSFNILYYLENEKQLRHAFIQKNIESVFEILQKNFAFNIERLKQLSVYDGMEYAIKQFELADKSDAYLTFLLDEVLRVEQQEDAGISTFLNYWEKKKDTLSIVAPESMNAIQVMTIHKAKGLEFPVVIFPYANSYLYEEIDPKLWLSLNEVGNEAFKEVLISKKKEVVHYNLEAASIYEEEQHKLELDAINLLYVALTRAIDALYIFTELDLTLSGAYKPHYYSGLFIHFLREQNVWAEGKTLYTFGKEAQNEAVEKLDNIENNIPYLYSNKENGVFRILTTSGILWGSNREEALSKGTTIHQLMEFIITKDDVEHVLNRFENISFFGQEKDTYREMLLGIINHPQLNVFFRNNLLIKNECDIITENGLILRPDRLVFKSSKVSILDYKTGKRSPKYQQQLHSYADALKAMGFEIDHMVIVYIDKKIDPEFI